jgi:nucleotide-binding universal stress UspA family protein
MYADDPMLAAAAAAGYNEQLLKQATMAELRRMLMCVGVPLDREPRAADMLCAIGRPAREIVKAAKRRKADLIVMGTQGRGGASKLLFGSTTDQILRHAPAPVLAIPSSASPVPRQWPGGLVIAGIELDADASGDARAMASLARAFEANVMFAHVVPTADGPPWLAATLRAHERQRIVAARGRLKNIVAGLEGAAAESRVLVGNPAKELSALALEADAALMMVMLRRGHGLFGPRQGSITYRILCEAGVPVLALRRETGRN